MMALTALKMAVLAPMPSVNVSDDHRGKRRRPAQRARRIPHVAPRLLDRGFPADVAGVVLHRLDAAKLHAGRSTRILGRHAGADLRLDGGFQVRPKLFVELLLDAPAAKQPLQSANEALEARHHSSPGDAARILAMAVGLRFPLPRLALELRPALRREVVVLRAPVVLGHAPLALDQAVTLQTPQRGEQRAGVDLESASLICSRRTPMP